MQRRWLMAAPVAAALMMAAGAIAPVSAAEVKSIAVLVPEQGTDFGWNQQGIDAGRAVAEKYGIEFVPADGLGYGDIRPTLRELSEEGVSLLIAHASGYVDAAAEIAAETGTPTALTGRPSATKPGLIADYTVTGYQGGYLAGVLAAKMTRGGTVGIVLSGEPPPWNTQSAAFAIGAKATRPDINILYAVIGPAAYSDAAGGRRVTEAVIAAGADIIFGQGNGSSFGMIEAVETSKATDGGDVWFIDVIGDKSSIDAGHLLSSVLWDLTPIYSSMVEDLQNDVFGTHTYSLGLADDSVRLLKTPHIPEDVWTDVMGVRQQIIDGTIVVPEIFDATEVRALMGKVDVPAQ